MYKTLHKKQGSVTVQLRFARSSVTFCAKRDTNMAKVIDGNYDKQQRPKGSKTSSTNKFNNFPQRDYDFDTLEQQLLNSQQEPQGDK